MMANPPWTNDEMKHHNAYSGNVTTPSVSSLMIHHSGIVVAWTPEEDKHLVEGLASYWPGSRRSLYVKLALGLQGKNARDVAIRCRWLNKNHENPKRRKEDHSGLKRARVDNEEMVVASQVFEPSQHGITNERLQQNMQYFSQISANFTSSSLMDNIYLFKKIRENINTLVNNLNENVSETMKRMPPLPEKLNDELFDAIERTSLPDTNLTKLP